MINLITEKQKVQAIVPDAHVAQLLDDSGIYYTIVLSKATDLTVKQRLALTLLYSPRTVSAKRTSTNSFTISTTYK